MSKIFGIGLSKTGTTSLAKALEMLGYRSVHWDVGLTQIDTCDAMTDSPVADAFEQLDRDYPGSKFIYTVRDRQAWLQSFCAQMARDQGSVRSPEHLALCRRLYGTAGYDPSLFWPAYERHHARVMSYFAERNDMLTMNICAGDGWEKLCPFLNHSIPAESFPYANTKEDIARRVRRTALARRLDRILRMGKPIVPKSFRRRIKAAIIHGG